MQLVTGKSALITGGGTGIGFGCAQRLLEQGATSIVIAGRREDVLEDAVERLRAFAGDARIDYQVCDIVEEEQVAAAVEKACVDGKLDILVANAGSGFPGPMIGLDAAAWRYCNDLNIVGSALCIKHAAKKMRANGGSIITISSTSARYHDEWMAPYGASKAALEHLSQTAALELARFKIRVNSVAPGYVHTESTDSNFPEGLADDCVARTPLGRCGEPEDLGDAIAFLGSDLSQWITGQVIGVDGGLNIHTGSDFGQVAQMVVGEDAMREAGYDG